MKKKYMKYKPEGRTSPEQKAIINAIMDVATAHAKENDYTFSTGGCTPFYLPTAWKARGEVYGHDSKLVVCHDGGDLQSFFNMDYEDYDAYELMLNALNKIGYFPEGLHNWCTGVYKI